MSHNQRLKGYTRSDKKAMCITLSMDQASIDRINELSAVDDRTASSTVRIAVLRMWTEYKEKEKRK